MSKAQFPFMDRTAQQHLESALWNWIHPSYAAQGADVDEEVEREMQAFSVKVLQDLVPLAQASPGLRARLARLAEQLDETLSVELDPVFELLYPESYVETEPAREAARQEGLRNLAEEWEQLGPEAMSQRLAWYEAEAERIGYSWPRGSQEICRVLANRVEDPLPWLEALLKVHLASSFVSPFLERLVFDRREGWDQMVNRCLEDDQHRSEAIDAVLQLQDAPPLLVEKALNHATTWPMSIETMASRRKMPSETLRDAFRHPSWEVALAAAVGEWLAGRENGVRDELRADWQDAVLRARTDDSRTGLQHWLAAILAKDPDLALDWLRARLRDADPPNYFLRGPFASAVHALRHEQRAQLLSELPALPILGSLLPQLVKRDMELYRQLLARAELRAYHLVPLGGKPDEAWSTLALVALDAGYPPERIASAATSGLGIQVIWGSGIDYWTGWEQAFAALQNHTRVELREVGRYGWELAKRQIQRAESEQERISLRGL